MLQDEFGRRFYYLRLSITDVCNFKCSYCLPDGYQKPAGDDCHSPLTLSEIQSIATAFAQLGTEKIRITGGEPAIRNDLPRIIDVCKSTPGIRSVGVTTNGYRLSQNIEQWVDAGLDRLNVSIDSLDPRQFHSITGHDRLNDILQGLAKAAQLGLSKVKINAVLLRQYNLKEFNDFLNWIRETPVTLRFIELMQTGENREFFQQNHVAGDQIKHFLLEQGWVPVTRSVCAGPAVEFTHSDYAGRIGLIMPYSKDFCESCNRLRVSSQGNLHLCLFGEQGLPLRTLCQPEKIDELKHQIQAYVAQKKVSHFLHQGDSGATRHLAMIGG